MAIDGDVMNVLQWSVRGVDARMSVPASRFQPFESFLGAPARVPGRHAPGLWADRVHRAHPGDVDLHRYAHARLAP